MDTSIQNYFKPIFPGSDASPKDYDQMQPYVHIAKSFWNMTYETINIIDYRKRRFFYVSNNPLFLCGNTPDEVLKAGYTFYLKNVPKKDLELLLQINEAAVKFHNNIPLNHRLQYSISYDFRLKQPGGHLMLINHKVAPMVLDKVGRVWIALCMISLSANEKPGNVIVKESIGKKAFEYDLTSKTWNHRKY